MYAHREVRGSALDDSWTNLKACFIISYPKSFKSYPLKTDLLHTALFKPNLLYYLLKLCSPVQSPWPCRMHSASVPLLCPTLWGPLAATLTLIQSSLQAHLPPHCLLLHDAFMTLHNQIWWAFQLHWVTELNSSMILRKLFFSPLCLVLSLKLQ